MGLSKKIILLLFLFFSERLFAQDTLVYHQANASMFSNYYTFIKLNKTDKQGRFIWQSGTDDLQLWYGKGTFKETNRHIHLTFDKINDSTRVEMIKSKRANDTIYIKWYDVNGAQSIFDILNINNPDSQNHNLDYFRDFIGSEETVAKICKKDLKSSLSLWQFRTKLCDFKLLSNNADSINIYCHNPKRIHEANKTSQLIRKTKKGLITEGMWIKKKKTLFVLKKSHLG